MIEFITQDPIFQNTIIQAIGSVGFPIVACCALFYLYDKTITKLTATLEKMDKTLDKLYDNSVNRDKEE